jgi:hypothetical protein
MRPRQNRRAVVADRALCGCGFWLGWDRLHDETVTVRGAAWAVIAILCATVAVNASEPAGAADTSSEEMNTVAVKGTGLSVQYPASWVVADYPKKLPELRKYFNKYPEFAKLAGFGASFSDRELKKLSKSLGEKRLFVADINGDADNMIVYVERLDPGDWWTDLAEFQAVGKQTAATLGMTELSAVETRVGNHQAFMSVDQDNEDGTFSVFMDVRKDKTTLVSFVLTVDSTSRNLGEAIVRSVKRSV